MFGLEFSPVAFINAVLGGTIGAVLGGAVTLAVTRGTRDRMSHNQRKIAEISAHLYQAVTGNERAASIDEDGYLRVDHTLPADPGSINLSGSEAGMERSAGGE